MKREEILALITTTIADRNLLTETVDKLDELINKKYCMPDGINSKKEHNEYLRTIGVIKKNSATPITKENTSIKEYTDSVNSILTNEHKWENAPSYQLVEMDYNDGKSVKESVECFVN